MKIISGKLRGRNIPTDKNADYRPSTSKFREAVFNILTMGKYGNIIEDAQVLDLYCGSGSLGLEAISRGASSVTFVDQNYNYITSLKKLCEDYKVSNHASFVKADACNLPTSHKSYDIVFMDPPYDKGYLGKTLQGLKSGWLKDGSKVVIEIPEHESLEGDENFELVYCRQYGSNKLIIFEYHI